MKALPIHLLRPEDSIIFGNEYIALAKIARSTKCVPKGLLISPPVDEIFAGLVKHRATNLGEFERNRDYINDTLLNTNFSHHIISEFEKENLILSQVWPAMVTNWLNQVHSIFLRFGSVGKNDLVLSSQLIFSFETTPQFGTAYMDLLKNHVVIKDEADSLDFNSQATLDQLVRLANHTLVIPHIYTYAVIEGKIFITKVIPFTNSDQENTSKIVNLTQEAKFTPSRKRVLKLFINLKNNFTLWEHANGIVINSANFTNEETKLHALTESCISIAPNPVIYKISGVNQNLRKEAEIIKFIRNKKALTNINLCISDIKSVDSLIAIKREIASYGVARKGSLLLWVEFSTPESLLNINAYIEAGFDGAVIQTDQLLSHLFGSSKTEMNLLHTEKRALTLTSFIQDTVKKLHGASVPVILNGENATLDEVIDFSIAKGIWGIELEQVKDYLTDQLSTKEFFNLRFGS